MHWRWSVSRTKFDPFSGADSPVQMPPSEVVANQQVNANDHMIIGSALFSTLPEVSFTLHGGFSTDMSVCSEPLRSNTTSSIAAPKEIGPGWKIAFDNINIFQKVREMTEDNQNKDHHLINHVRVTNRVSGNHLPDDKPLCDSVLDLDNYKVIPTVPEHISQSGNYILLISVAHIGHPLFFSPFTFAIRIFTAKIQVVRFQKLQLEFLPQNPSCVRFKTCNSNFYRKNPSCVRFKICNSNFNRRNLSCVHFNICNSNFNRRNTSCVPF